MVGVDSGSMGLGQVLKYQDWTAGEEKAATHLVDQQGKAERGKGERVGCCSAAVVAARRGQAGMPAASKA